MAHDSAAHFPWPGRARQAPPPAAALATPVCAGCATCGARAACARGAASQVELIAKWGGSAATFLGSLLLATAKGAGASPYVFLLFLAGNSAWALAGVKTRDKALVATSLVGAAFNISATLIRL